MQYNIVHNKKSVKSFEDEVVVNNKCSITDEEWNKIQKRIAEEKEKEEIEKNKELREETEKAIQTMKDKDMIVEEDKIKFEEPGDPDYQWNKEVKKKKELVAKSVQAARDSGMIDGKGDGKLAKLFNESPKQAQSASAHVSQEQQEQEQSSLKEPPPVNQEKALEALDKMTVSVGSDKLRKLSEEEIEAKEEEVKRRDKKYLKELNAPVNLEELMKGARHKRI